MAVNVHGVRFLLHAADVGVDFTRPATLGHLSLLGDTSDLAEALAACRGEGPEVAAQVFRDCAGYADGILRYLGAENVDSIDASDYQNATVVHDLNIPVPPDLEERFSALIDGGTLEHVFEFPTAIRNSMRMVRQGGHLILNLPVNNFPGHGFYQFSPELLFRVLTPRFGFHIRELLVRDDYRPRSGWFRVTDPAELGRRVQFRSNARTVMYVLAERTGPVPDLSPSPEQSDYALSWQYAVEDTSTAGASSPDTSFGAGTGTAPVKVRPSVPRQTMAVLKEHTPVGLKRTGQRAVAGARARLRRSRAAYRFRLWTVWAFPPLGHHPHYATAPGFVAVHERWTAPAPGSRRSARHLNAALPVRYGRP